MFGLVGFLMNLEILMMNKFLKKLIGFGLSVLVGLVLVIMFSTKTIVWASGQILYQNDYYIIREDAGNYTFNRREVLPENFDNLPEDICDCHVWNEILPATISTQNGDIISTPGIRFTTVKSISRKEKGCRILKFEDNCSWEAFSDAFNNYTLGMPVKSTPNGQIGCALGYHQGYNLPVWSWNYGADDNEKYLCYEPPPIPTCESCQVATNLNDSINSLRIELGEKLESIAQILDKVLLALTETFEIQEAGITNSGNITGGNNNINRGDNRQLINCPNLWNSPNAFYNLLNKMKEKFPFDMVGNIPSVSTSQVSIPLPFGVSIPGEVIFNNFSKILRLPLLIAFLIYAIIKL